MASIAVTNWHWKKIARNIGFILFMGLIGCSGVSVSTQTPIIVGKEPGGLVIYSGRSESLVAPIIAQFGQASGINVDVKYAKTPLLANLLLEEGSKSPADVFFAQDPGGLGAVEGLLEVLPEPTLNLVPDWAKDPNSKWVGISGRARTVVYNNDNIAELDLPDDMWGFTNPEWNGKIGWAPTNASFQTMVTGMRSDWGEDLTRQWLIQMQANQPKVYPKNTPQVAAVAAGEIEVAFVNHYYLHRFLSTEGENFSARNYHPRAGGPGSLIMISGAGILKSANNEDNARKFIEFMLSPVAQQFFSSQTFEYPLVEGVKTSLVLVPLSDIDSPNIAVKDLSDLEGTVRLLQETNVLP